ncbi:HlyD family secretion protein [Thioclava sp. IC9]|uniref:HlyD family secretion protein n=1 Tax=Thioclava sp. IC9 TaxID=1973007 RepID=UPI000B544C45|nr:HlyD family secretion protein [Thioclava sp. IC9]OWY02995.1 hemolysin secretion protein D [Thioclava sp. IC9]
MSQTRRYIASALILLIALAGVATVLYAWRLPPFRSDVAWTDNAYLQGKVTPISAQVAAEVTAVPVSDFEEVKKGDVLVRLDDRALKAAVEQAQAALETAKAAQSNGAQAVNSAKATLEAKQAALASAKAAQATAQTARDRASKLTKKSYVSQSDADQAQLTLDQAKAGVQEAQSAIDVAQQAVQTAELNKRSLAAKTDAAQASLDAAQVALDHAVIRAPQDGRLGQVSARVGKFVSAGSTLVSLVPSDLWLIANYKETQLAGLRMGELVTFTVDALGKIEFKGHIERFSPATAGQFSLLSGSNATGNFTKIAQRVPVRISIDPDQPQTARLAPGLSAEVSAPQHGS